jgi:hypothetical protein
MSFSYHLAELTVQNSWRASWGQAASDPGSDPVTGA